MKKEGIQKNFFSEDEDKPTQTAVKPDKVIKLYGFRLTNYEKKEIFNYDEIYFIGGPIKQAQNLKLDKNFFDDQKGSYLYKSHDHIAYRYEILSLIGKGAFGQVFKCYDHRTDKKVALKIIKNKPQFHRQAKMEIKILSLLKKVDKDDRFNFVHMKNYFNFRGHFCITFELLTINLHDLRQRSEFVGFSFELIKRFAYSIVKSLCMLNKLKIIHSDLKPENIVLKERNKCGIKIIDFGTSCFENEIHYKYIQSRYYRAPEVIVQIKYGLPIDMWSFGCLIYELSSGNILFDGKDEFDQIFAIIEVLGDLPKAMLRNEEFLDRFVSQGYGHFDKKNGKLIKSNPYPVKKVFRFPPGQKKIKFVAHSLKSQKDQFKDFILKCVTLDPEKRMTPKEALNHSYLKLNKVKSKNILNKIEILKKSYYLNSSSNTHLKDEEINSSMNKLTID